MRRTLLGAVSALVLSWQVGTVGAGDGANSLLPGQPAPPTGNPPTLQSGSFVNNLLPGQPAPQSSPGVSVVPTSTATTTAPVVSDAAPVDFSGGEGTCQKCGHIVGGIGAYFLKPRFDQNPAFTRAVETFSSGNSNSSSTIALSSQDFGYDPSVSPLLYFGYVSDCGLGVRARWFQFDQGSSVTGQNGPLAPSTGSTTTDSVILVPTGNTFVDLIRSELFGSAVSSSNPNQVDSLSFTSHLLLQVWDLEATQDLQTGPWSFLFAGGVRYLHMAQRYGMYSKVLVPGGNTDGLLNGDSTFVFDHDFNGVGPTLAIEAERRLGSSGLSLYGTARGAVLFGKANGTEAGIATSVSSNQANAVSTSTFVNTESHNKVLPVLEFEVGVQYGWTGTRFSPFIRSGFVGQSYFGAGSATSMDGNLGLFGLSVTAGTHF
jgi:hypothetical protein